MPVTQTKSVFPSICVCLQKKTIMLLTANTCTADNLLTEVIKARWYMRMSLYFITRRHLKHIWNIELTLGSFLYYLKWHWMVSPQATGSLFSGPGEPPRPPCSSQGCSSRFPSLLPSAMFPSCTTGSADWLSWGLWWNHLEPPGTGCSWHGAALTSPHRHCPCSPPAAATLLVMPSRSI